MTKDELKKLRNRATLAAQNRSAIEGVWDYIEQFVAPFRAALYPDLNENAVNWRRWGIFDSTAVIANQILASNIHSGLTNSSYKWLDMRFSGMVGLQLNKNPEAIRWIGDNAELVYDGISESNFGLKASELYLDLPSFGTGTMLKESVVVNNTLEKWVFTSVPISDSYFEEDYMGQPNRWYRELHWTSNAIFSKWPKDTIEEDARRKLEKADANVKHKILFCIFPRDGVSPSPNVTARENRPWGGVYFLTDSLTQLGEEEGYYDFPVFIPRWRTTSGSQWGHSPAMVSLGDILTLNQFVKLVLTAGEKVLDPALLVKQRGVFGNIQLGASQTTVVKDVEKSIRAFESKARFDVSGLTKQDMQMSIKEAFYNDKLELKKSPVSTATEVQGQFELMARLLGPTYERFQIDFLNPLVLSCFGDMHRYRVVSAAPQIVQDAQAEMKIEYLGPMARAQKLDKVQAIERLLAGVAGMAEAYPEALDLIDVDEAVYATARYLGTPGEILKDSNKVRVIRKLKQQVQNLQQQLAMAGGAAQVAKDGAEAVNKLGGVSDGLKQITSQAA